jgi:hypothetical protein
LILSEKTQNLTTETSLQYRPTLHYSVLHEG